MKAFTHLDAEQRKAINQRAGENRREQVQALRRLESALEIKRQLAALRADLADSFFGCSEKIGGAS